MLEFKILKKSGTSRARLGILKTPHGEVETPTLVPVATQAVVKTLTGDEAIQAGCQILIANTFHLHLKPSEDIIAANGGIHEFMNWPRPLMTDSGGFQVFSLGFGRDHGVGKILKEKIDETISVHSQPNHLKITADGVRFHSPLDGSSLFMGPVESITAQQMLGADIIFAFDEATSPVADEEYTAASLERTHRWAKQSLAAKTSGQALYGIVQGGKFPELRQASARYHNSLPFDGFGIGGEYGDDKQTMHEMLNLVIPELTDTKPRHLLGIGHPEDLLPIIQAGVDTFDCIAPTHYARHGTAFVSQGVRYSKSKYLTPSIRLDLTSQKFLTDQKPLDPGCPCLVCQQYKRSYLAHLIRAKEITGLKLLTYHNLFYFNHLVAQIREQIKNGRI